MPPHRLTNFEIQKYYQNETKFDRVYSTYNLPEVKDEAYLINLGKFKSIENHLTAFCKNGDGAIYFDSFRIEHIRKEIKNS